MTSDEAEKRIALQEQELANIQAGEGTEMQFEANVARENLKKTLSIGESFAATVRDVLSHLSSKFDAVSEQMAKDLGGINDDR